MTHWTLIRRSALRNGLRTCMTISAVATAVLAFIALRTVFDAWNAGAQLAAKDRLSTRNRVSFAAALPYKYVAAIRDSAPAAKAVTFCDWFGGRWAFAVLFAVAAILGAMLTLHTTVAERRREIGTLRALGFSRMQVLGSFLIEAVVLALAGGALGLVAALLLSLEHVSMVNTATWAELSFRFEPSASVIATAVLGAASMGVLGGLLNRRAGRPGHARRLSRRVQCAFDARGFFGLAPHVLRSTTLR